MTLHLQNSVKTYSELIGAFEGLYDAGIDEFEAQEALKDRIRLHGQSLLEAFTNQRSNREEALRVQALRSEFKKLFKRFHRLYASLLEARANQSDRLIASPRASSVFQKRSDVKIERKEDLEALIELEQKQQLEELEKGLQSIQEVSKDFAALVQQQGRELVKAEVEVERTDVVVRRAVDDLEQAKAYQNKAAKLWFWGVFLFVLGVCVGVGSTASVFVLS